MRVSNEHFIMDGQRRGECECECGADGLRQSNLDREWVEERPLISVYHIPISDRRRLVGKKNRQSHPTMQDGSGGIIRTVRGAGAVDRDGHKRAKKKGTRIGDSLFFRARDIRACTDSATRSALLARP